MDVFYLYLDKYVFSGKKHEKEHSAGLFLVEYAAKNFYKIQNSEIEVIKEKPCFKYSDINFSISHSDNIAAVCFDNYPVGFDIEQIKNRDYISIAKRLNFKLKNNSIEEFYKCWTRYESEYKLQQRAVNFLSQKFQDKYILSVASSSKDIIKITYHLVNV